ncbi:MAG: hypothetical protein R3D32_07015 [Nitratireductor sp.]
MADFEGLIRQALARQDDSDPVIREKVYQSSRNALERMIASAKAQDPATSDSHRDALEVSIRRIESGYAQSPAPAPNVQSLPPRLRPAPPLSAETQPVAGSVNREVRVEHGFDSQGRAEPVMLDDPYSDYPDDDGYDDTLDYGADEDDRNHVSKAMLARRGSSAKRNLVIAVTLLAILGFGWLGYGLYSEIFGASDSSQQEQPGTADSANATGGEDVADATYIVLLSAADSSALDTSGRGTAEIVNQSNTEMLRLASLRPGNAREETAKPILLAVQPGVLSRIAGKKVTVEIRAKSGGTGPANFAVSCEFDSQELCGRKRFRVGLQPEVMIFKLSVPAEAATVRDAHFLLNTDITGAAAISGQGDLVDIQYARLRLDEE